MEICAEFISSMKELIIYYIFMFRVIVFSFLVDIIIMRSFLLKQKISTEILFQ